MARGKDYLGPYRLLRLARAGKTCRIWEAVRDAEQRRVALKVLTEDFRGNREEIGYLKQEFAVAQSLNGLKHPNLVEIYEFYAEKDQVFLALEFITGMNLKQALRAQPERVAYEAERIVREAANGLAQLHQAGWVHRDIKPDNFMLPDEGPVKLIDFAIAQKVKRGFASWFSRGKVQGTRSYMSPEQIRGEALDVRADIYSFGCMLYEILAGKPPFTGKDANDLLNRHLKSAAPSVLSSNDNITVEYAALVQQLIAKDKEQRPESLDAFMEQASKTKMYRVRPQPPANTEATP